MLKVLETGWSLDFDEALFDEQSGLVVLPLAACPA